jgi:hypothetical protein
MRTKFKDKALKLDLFPALNRLRRNSEGYLGKMQGPTAACLHAGRTTELRHSPLPVRQIGILRVASPLIIVAMSPTPV